MAHDVQLNPGPPTLSKCTICDLTILRKILGSVAMNVVCLLIRSVRFQGASMFGLRTIVNIGIVMHVGPHVHYAMVTSLMAAKGYSVIIARPGTTPYAAVLMKKHTSSFRILSMAGFVYIVWSQDMKTHFLVIMT